MKIHTKKLFYLQLNDMDFKRGEAITFGNSEFPSGIVVKVFKNTWWRKFLRKIGFKIRINQVKVKYYE